MSRPLNSPIAILVFVAMAAVPAAPPVQGQTPSATSGVSGARAETSTANASDKPGARSTSTGSSRWGAGATSFTPSAKGAWGGSQSFSSTPKSAWTSSSGVFSQGGVQSGGVWHTRPSLSEPPEGATLSNRSELSVSSMGTHTSGIVSHQSDRGSRQYGIRADRPTMSAHRFGMVLQGGAGGKPAFGISGRRQSFKGNRSGGARSMGGGQSVSVSAAKLGTTGLNGRPGAPPSGPPLPRFESGLGLTGSGFDQNHWETGPHPGESKPR
jgi:hypothetical protein